MAKTNKFTVIDDLLPITTKGKGKEKTRKIAKDRTIDDGLAKEMAGCQLPSEIAMMASKFGFKDEDIIQWAKDAPNFGMFRMRVGNRCRGVLARIAKAKQRGVDLSVKEAAYAKRTRADRVLGKKNTAKKAKTEKKPAKKVKAVKTAKKATKKEVVENPAPKKAEKSVAKAKAKRKRSKRIE